MTRDEIYDHLAQVYLGKRKEADSRKKRQLSAWLLINIFIMVIIFASAFYGLTAFFTRGSASLRSNIIFSLHSGLARVEYSFDGDFPPVKTFSLRVPRMDAREYSNIQFSIRAKDEGNPGVVKVVLKNSKGEGAAYYVQGIDSGWQDFSIPLGEFKQITDWTSLRDVSFVLEPWNVESKNGVILIDNICFSS